MYLSTCMIYSSVKETRYKESSFLLPVFISWENTTDYNWPWDLNMFLSWKTQVSKVTMYTDKLEKRIRKSNLLLFQSEARTTTRGGGRGLGWYRVLSSFFLSFSFKNFSWILKKKKNNRKSTNRSEVENAFIYFLVLTDLTLLLMFSLSAFATTTKTSLYLNLSWLFLTSPFKTFFPKHKPESLKFMYSKNKRMHSHF